MTRQVKTAISINDDILRRVEAATAALGITRSEFFTRAAELYLRHLQAESLTKRIDETLTRIGPDNQGDEW